MWIKTHPALYASILCAQVRAITAAPSLVESSVCQVVSFDDISLGLRNSNLNIPEATLKRFMEHQVQGRAAACPELAVAGDCPQEEGSPMTAYVVA